MGRCLCLLRKLRSHLIVLFCFGSKITAIFPGLGQSFSKRFLEFPLGPSALEKSDLAHVLRELVEIRLRKNASHASPPLQPE